MPDFLAYVREHLPPLGVSGERQLEVVEELAHEMQERYDALIRQGEDPQSAWEHVCRGIQWDHLGQQVGRALHGRTNYVSQFITDARYGLRQMFKSPGFAATAILTIALGVGPNTAIFSLLYGVFWDPGDNPAATRQTVIWQTHGTEQGFGVKGGIHVTARDLREWRRQSKSFERIDAIVQRQATLNDDSGYPERFQVQSYTPGTITKYFGARMILGRDFVEEEGEFGKSNVVVISHRFWQQRYKGDPKTIGKQIRLDGINHTIVGVIAPGWWDRRRESMWPALALPPEGQGNGNHTLTALALRKPGVTLEQAQKEMEAVAARIAQVYPETNTGWSVRVDANKNSWLSDRARSNLSLLMVAVSLVLLIACLNVANLLMARGQSRVKEIAVRVSMGATKGQIFRQLLTESLTLSVAGGIAGVALSFLLMRVFTGLMPPFFLPPQVSISLSPDVLLFTLGSTILAGLIFGCAPAIQMARLGVAESLRQGGGKSGIGQSRHLLGKGLVVLEFAMALTLLAGAGIVLQSYWNRMHINLGLRTENVLTFELPPNQQRLTSPQAVMEYNRAIREKIASVPGVSSVTASPVPLTGTGKVSVAVAKRLPASGAPLPQAALRLVAPQFVETYGARMMYGREFNDLDQPASLKVAMVNEKFVKQYMAGLTPLDEELVVGERKLQVRVVGVYGDIQNAEVFGGEIKPEVTISMAQFNVPITTMAVRSAVPSTQLTKSIAAVIHEFDPLMPMSKVKTMGQIVDEQTAFDRFEAALYGSFAALALLLAAIGIYGLIAFLVSQRTGELGMRMALGAGTQDVFRLVLKDGLKLATVGLITGGAGAYYGGKFLQTTLYGAQNVDPVALGAVALLLLTAAVIACVIPAWRASRVDPVESLRSV